jgi:hypothetical protein
MKIRALAVLLPLLALAGCADDNVSMQVFGICAPPEDECVFSGECEAYTLAPLRLDVAQSPFYWAFVEVHNQTAQNDDETAGRPNTHDAYVEEFTVEYEAPTLPGTRALPTVTKRLESGPSVVPAEGTAVISVYPITAEVGAIIRDDRIADGGTYEVLAKVRLRGFFADQTRFETAEFPMPIQVCDGAGCADIDCDPLTAGVQPPVAACPKLGQGPVGAFCP